MRLSTFTGHYSKEFDFVQYHGDEHVEGYYTMGK